jgi:outer membrane lipoprotein-sorting protein
MEDGGWKMAIARVFSILHLPSSILLFPLLALTACQHPYQEHIPSYPRVDEEATLAQLAQQSNLVHTMSGSGTLQLTQPKGQTVRLDVAVVLQPPDRARIRAWKLGNAVFDLTALPDGVWLESSHDSPHPQQGIGPTAAPVAKAWSLLDGSFFRSPNLVTRNDGKWFIAQSTDVNGPTMIAYVERDTLTPRQYQILDAVGRVQFTLTLDHYQDFSGHLWPRRIVATSEAGIVAVDLNDVELNGELPPLAFKPPRSAEKLP